MKRIEQMSLWERLYFPEVFRGLMVTGYRFLAKSGDSFATKVRTCEVFQRVDHGPIS